MKEIRRAYTVAMEVTSSALTSTGKRRNTATDMKPRMHDRGMYSGNGHQRLRTNSCDPGRLELSLVMLGLQGTTYGKSHVNWNYSGCQ